MLVDMAFEFNLNHRQGREIMVNSTPSQVRLRSSLPRSTEAQVPL